MKKVAVLLFIASSLAFAQEQSVSKGYHTHDGFYYSLSFGPGFGKITQNASGSYYKTLEISGTGINFDGKIGWAIWEEQSLILSLDLAGRMISKPTYKEDGVEITTTSDDYVSDMIVGLGITKYFMPDNYFVSATIGSGGFSVGSKDASVNSKSGISFQIKGGKRMVAVGQLGDRRICRHFKNFCRWRVGHIVFRDNIDNEIFLTRQYHI